MFCIVCVNKLAIDYYGRRFKGNINNAFIHLVTELRVLALATEKANSEHAKLKIKIAIALLKIYCIKIQPRAR